MRRASSLRNQIENYELTTKKGNHTYIFRNRRKWVLLSVDFLVRLISRKKTMKIVVCYLIGTRNVTILAPDCGNFRGILLLLF